MEPVLKKTDLSPSLDEAVPLQEGRPPELTMLILGTCCLGIGVVAAGASAAVLTVGLLTEASNAVLQSGLFFILGLLLAALGRRLRNRETA